MPKGKDIHVVPAKNGWAAKAGGASRAAKVTPTQREAIEVAKKIATKRGVDVVTHGRDGKIRSKDSYGHDPVPPHDKEH